MLSACHDTLHRELLRVSIRVTDHRAFEINEPELHIEREIIENSSVHLNEKSVSIDLPIKSDRTWESKVVMRLFVVR